MKKFVGIFLLFLTLIAKAQGDSCTVRISLLTCTPGSELYSTFGHSAFRVTDPSREMDIIFNYGTFDFEDPQFYKKFTLGKLLYFVSVDPLDDFLYEYKFFKRGVTEQVLNLECREKEDLVAALFENAKEENKYYLYDFVYDNCTTRLRDMLENATGGPLQAKDIRPSENTTFRHLIHDYLHKGNHYWSKFGIDILLGSPLDKQVSNREAMFLPDYLMMAFDSATYKGRPLVTERNQLLPAGDITGDASVFTPLVILGIMMIVIIALSFFPDNAAQVFLKAFDVFFFGILGMLGLFLLFMWFGTNHPMCRNNFNLLWALPTHLPMAVMLFSGKEWVRTYFSFVLFYSILLMAAWFLLPQQMNNALLPVVVIMAVRSYRISKTGNRWKKN